MVTATTELIKDAIEDFAQRVVDDMDIDDLMNAVKQSIIERMEDEDDDAVFTEISESAYSDVLEDNGLADK